MKVYDVESYPSPKVYMFEMSRSGSISCLSYCIVFRAVNEEQSVSVGSGDTTAFSNKTKRGFNVTFFAASLTYSLVVWSVAM